LANRLISNGHCLPVRAFTRSATTGPILSEEKMAKLERTRSARARQQAIGRELRRLYDNIIQEPVPDEFLELLKKMETEEQDPAAGSGPP